jgi:hypothetical protein
MSLKTDLVSNEEKLRVLGSVIDDLCARKKSSVRDDPDFFALKSIAHDIKSRMELPRSNTLGEIERALQRTEASKTAIGFDTGQLSNVAYTIMKHWPVIRQALEHFGEVSAE